MIKGGTMKNPFKLKIFKNVIVVLVVLLLAKLLWVVVAHLWLSTYGVNHKAEVGGKGLYYRVKLSTNKAPPPPPPKVKPKKVVKIAGSIKDIKLKAIYNSENITVITITYKRKTKILGLGDVVNGFTLSGGGSKYAIFVKDSKNYKVELEESKKSKNIYNSIKFSKDTPKKSKKPTESSPEGEIIDAGDHKIIDKSLIEYYTKNMESIYKNIGIRDLKKGNKIDGFMVTFVRRGTPFAKLGLKRGDILKAINGHKLNSYKAAFDAYKNATSMSNVTLVIERKKEEMELEYEVN
jgi:general secretion pathway protein C